MGIFSFYKKFTGQPIKIHDRIHESINTHTEDKGDNEFFFDPKIYEKRQGRRRLVGSIVLIVIAIMILSMVLDQSPKPISNDIVIDILNQSKHQSGI
ncbi:MAG: hypothetical protein REV36_01845 [Burkholderia sp.]|nr:hypothetical protein [Burkholderia sp.]